MGAIQQPFAFIGSQTLSLVNGNTATTRPTFCRFARFAFSVERLGNRRAAFFDFTIRLRFRQVSYFQRQTTRSSKPLNGAVCEASVIQLRSKVRSKGLSQAAQCFWWQLFSARFPTRKVFSDIARLLLIFVHIGKPRASREA